MRDIVCQLKANINKLSDIKSVCVLQMSKCDKQLSDIAHYIELEDLGAVQLRKLGEKQRDILKRRRICKKELIKFSALSKIFKAGNVLELYDAHVKGAEGQKYTCRELTLEQALA